MGHPYPRGLYNVCLFIYYACITYVLYTLLTKLCYSRGLNELMGTTTIECTLNQLLVACGIALLAKIYS